MTSSERRRMSTSRPDFERLVSDFARQLDFALDLAALRLHEGQLLQRQPPVPLPAVKCELQRAVIERLPADRTEQPGEPAVGPEAPRHEIFPEPGFENERRLARVDVVGPARCEPQPAVPLQPERFPVREAVGREIEPRQFKGAPRLGISEDQPEPRVTHRDPAQVDPERLARLFRRSRGLVRRHLRRCRRKHVPASVPCVVERQRRSVERHILELRSSPGRHRPVEAALCPRRLKDRAFFRADPQFFHADPGAEYRQLDPFRRDLHPGPVAQERQCNRGQEKGAGQEKKRKDQHQRGGKQHKKSKFKQLLHPHRPAPAPLLLPAELFLQLGLEVAHILLARILSLEVFDSEPPV